MTSSPGLDVLRVGNDTLELAFLPQRGGRLISLRVEGAELLWRNPDYLADDFTEVLPLSRWAVGDGTMGSWANVGGGKTWPAPQGWEGDDQWPGPPDEVLDAGPYEVLSHALHAGAATVALRSRQDVRSGLQITRTFAVPPRGGDFVQTISFHNSSNRRRRWSMWEVVQVDTGRPHGPGGHCVVGLEDGGRAETLVAASGSPRWELSADGTQVVIPIQDVVGKLGFPGALGHISWQRADGASLSLHTDVDLHRSYPDGGCPVELWLQHPVAAPLPELDGLHPKAHLVELEVLSPLYDIEPGQTVSMEVRWSCRSRVAPS